ncbi:23S rRNA (pseudouridine(1915)-N(3))-methyltransferase RlmH [Flexibacterium corallicola]|uniref:23S rRNA (pseudouridine(1915)-N(3))-methyltransferase RlmH n=1 Tax=Flexibacterium corallicola TaxID=3037259 RepID=UPI00286EED58|nr:23S rRNA (pseudouridine(1915)-N(3))-methyltransferase RlmH [Pseudovibrio sp. M1P-2-3]
MRITIACVGKMKAGAERDICERYLERARKAGRSLGVKAVSVVELSESRAARTQDRKAEEAAALLKAIPAGATVVVLDEHGKSMGSEAFAQKISSSLDQGIGDFCLVIGGADGHGRDILEKAQIKLALGAMTWPHQLVRILLAEQVYRAITILSGHPYHRV